MCTVKEVPAASASTVAALVATLREATGRVDLELAAPAVRLTGGFYAEMLRFRLADAPPGLEGDLVARIVPDPIAGEWEAGLAPDLGSKQESLALWVDQAGDAAALGHRDIAAAGERLLATEPRSRALVITHGDLHPFNVIATDAGPALVDWTVARVAHPGFTLGFADLMLANPPIRLPAAGAAVMRRLGRSVARRFLATYGRLTDGTDSAVDTDNLDWHRKVHALRILVELAGWDAAGTHPAAHHPWLVLEPVACSLLGVGLVGAHTQRG